MNILAWVLAGCGLALLVGAAVFGGLAALVEWRDARMARQRTGL